MLIETISQNWFLARTVNATDASLPATIPSATGPAGNGSNAAQAVSSAVFNLRNEGALIQNGIVVVPFGAGSSTNTFSVELIGWRSLGPGNKLTEIWVPVNLCLVQATLGTTTGVNGTLIPSTGLFATSLSLTIGNANVSIDIVSPGDNSIAHFVADLKGFQRLQVNFETGSSATSCNALLSFL